MKKIIIVGGGIAGLTAGIYAQLNGFESEICEKHSVAGGSCAYWQRKGYSIDGSISYLMGVNPEDDLYQVWQELQAFTPGDIYYNESFVTVREGNQELVWYRDYDKLEQELIRISPAETEQIQTLIHDLKLMKHMKMPVKKSMEEMNAIDWVLQVKAMGPVLKVSNKYLQVNTRELAQSFEHPLIQRAILSFVPETFQAMTFMTIASAFATKKNGKLYGGAQKLTTNLLKRYEALSGKMHLKAATRQINVENGKAVSIELANGEIKTADYIIAACDPSLIFNGLLEEQYMNKDFQQAFKNPEQFHTHTMTQLFFGAATDLSHYPAHLNVSCDPFEVNGITINEIGIEHFCENPLQTPQGKTVVKIGLMGEDYDSWKSLSRKEYLAKKEALTELYQSKLEEIIPEIVGKIEMIDVSTPLTFERYTGANQGAYMGFELLPRNKKQYLSNRVAKVDNMLLASQWNMVSGGLPSAVVAGKAAVQRICKVNKKKFVGVS